MDSMTRENIINSARQKYPNVELGEKATIASTEYGYWVAVRYYVGKDDVQDYEKRHLTPPLKVIRSRA